MPLFAKDRLKLKATQKGGEIFVHTDDLVKLIFDRIADKVSDGDFKDDDKYTKSQIDALLENLNISVDEKVGEELIPYITLAALDELLVDLRGDIENADSKIIKTLTEAAKKEGEVVADSIDGLRLALQEVSSEISTAKQDVIKLIPSDTLTSEEINRKLSSLKSELLKKIKEELEDPKGFFSLAVRRSRHVDLTDMPDTEGTNTDHDARYVPHVGNDEPDTPATPFIGQLWIDEDEEDFCNNSVQTVSSNTTASLDDDRIRVDASAGPVTIFGYAAVTGKPLQIKKIDSSANAVIFDPNGSELVDGAATYSITVPQDNKVFEGNGVDGWDVL